MAISKTQPMRSAEIELIDEYNAIIEDLPDLKTTIETLIDEVGDENSGLVKEVNDLDTTVNGIESAIGDENSGLVKDVDDLQSDVSSLQNTVGDENSGVVKDIDDLENAVFGLQTVIGDENSGLVKDVDDFTEWVSLPIGDYVTLDDDVNFNFDANNSSINKIGNFILLDIHLTAKQALTQGTYFQDVLTLSDYYPPIAMSFLLTSSSVNASKFWFTNGVAKMTLNENKSTNAPVDLRCFYPIL